MGLSNQSNCRVLMSCRKLCLITEDPRDVVGGDGTMVLKDDAKAWEQKNAETVSFLTKSLCKLAVCNCSRRKMRLILQSHDYLVDCLSHGKLL